MEQLGKEHTGTNAKKTDKQNWKSKNTELINREEISETPFIIVRQDGRIMLTLGDYKITESEDNDIEKQKIIKQVREKDWNILMGVIGAIIDVNNRMAEKIK